MDKIKRAHKLLKDRIFSGYYLPRERLIESEISKDFGINRMIVREILKRLTLEGLVVSQPYKGCRVADISVRHAHETYQIEAVLEGFAAFLATNLIGEYELKKLEDLINESKKIDPQEVEKWEEYNRYIHKAIIKSCRNSRLINIIRDNIKFSNYWFIILSTPGQIPKKNLEHELILAGIKERNAEKVRQLVENHIMKAAEDITERVQNLFPIFKSSKKGVGYK